MSGWIGVDFDGTLAEYNKWQGAEHCGAPIQKMCDRVRKWLAEGKEVRIFTARVYVPPMEIAAGYIIHAEERAKRMDEARTSRKTIQDFCVREFGHALPITCQKDFGMITLYDDRCVQVEPNTGRIIGEESTI